VAQVTEGHATQRKMTHFAQRSFPPSANAEAQRRPWNDDEGAMEKAAIGRVLLRLVMGQEHNTLPLVELVDTVLCRMNKRHSSLHAWALAKHGKTHTRKNTGMSL